MFYVYKDEIYKNAQRDIKAVMFDIAANEETRINEFSSILEKQPESQEKAQLWELLQLQKQNISSLMILTNKLSEVLSSVDNNSYVLGESFSQNQAVYSSPEDVVASDMIGQLPEDAVYENVSEFAPTEISAEESLSNESLKLTEETPQEAVDSSLPDVPVESAVELPEVPVDVESVPTEEVSQEAVDSTLPDVPVENAVELPEVPVDVESVPTEEVSQEAVDSTLPDVPVESAVELPEVPVDVENVPTEEVAQEAVAPALPDVPVESAVELPEVPVDVENVPTEEVAQEAVAPALPDVPVESAVELPEVPVDVESVPTEEVPQEAVAPALPDVSVESAVELPEVPVDVENVPTEEVPQEVVTPALPDVSVESAVELPEVPVDVENIPTEEVPQEAVAPALPDANVVVNNSEVVLPDISLESQPATSTEATEPLSGVLPVIEQPSTDGINLAPLDVSNTSDSQENSTDSAVQVLPLSDESVVSDTNNVLDKKADFVAASLNFSRAILTTKTQVTKLRGSHDTQLALFNKVHNADGLSDITEQQLIDNGLLPPSASDVQKQIEQMMEQANNLYKEGKADEAQKMYDQISNLNKQLQVSTGSMAK